MTSKTTRRGARRFEFIEGQSARFWEIRLTSDGFNIRYGKIGTDGRILVKHFADRTTAAEQAEFLVTERLLDGYQEVAALEPRCARSRALALLEEECSSPALKKAIRIYAGTCLPYCLPVFLPFDRSDPQQRLADQVVGGLPFVSAAWPCVSGCEEARLFAADPRTEFAVAGRGSERRIEIDVVQAQLSRIVFSGLLAHRCLDVGAIASPDGYSGRT